MKNRPSSKSKEKTQTVSRPITDVNKLKTVSSIVAAAIKTGQDKDRSAVGKSVIDGQDLGAGIVPATVEELISMPRPLGLEVGTEDPPEFQNERDGTAEKTI